MHKSVIILSILFFCLEVSAGEGYRNSEERTVAALNLIPGWSHEDFAGLPNEKNKRESFDLERPVKSRPVKFALEKYLLQENQKLEREKRQLERENDFLRSKLAVSPEELSKNGESSNPDKFLLNSGSSSNGTSPITIKVSSSRTTFPITKGRSVAKGSVDCLTCDTPCGTCVHSSAGLSSSFPGYGKSLLTLVANKKNISPLIPYSDGGCFYP